MGVRAGINLAEGYASSPQMLGDFFFFISNPQAISYLLYLEDFSSNNMTKLEKGEQFKGEKELQFHRKINAP